MTAIGDRGQRRRVAVDGHKIGEQGGKLGPDLSQIGKKLTRAQIVESLLEPSKTIDPKYVARMVETMPPPARAISS